MRGEFFDELVNPLNVPASIAREFHTMEGLHIKVLFMASPDGTRPDMASTDMCFSVLVADLVVADIFSVPIGIPGMTDDG